MRTSIYRLLNYPQKRGDAAWWVNCMIMILIVLNGLMIVLESIPALRLIYFTWFQAFEWFSVIVFTVEYVLRVWTADLEQPGKRPVAANVRYLFTPLALIDLLAILPFYLPFFGADLRILRMLRIFRLFRLFKIARYVTALTLIGEVFRRKREELLISLVFTLFVLLIASSLMYFVENEAQPDHFTSIPETMWWGIATLTTVGYGDVYPITAIGKFLGGIIAIVGISVFALPTGILAAGFSEALHDRRKGGHFCPHCGKEID